MSIVYATALPCFPKDAEEGRLRELCARLERAAAPRLSPGQRVHCRRFAPRGEALRARCSRLMARLLALRALPLGANLDRDAAGRPCAAGAPGWQIAFSHSGCAAFCLVRAPGEMPGGASQPIALDAEAWTAPASCDRAFAAPAPARGAQLRRWLLAEALFKALGAEPARWGHVAAAAQAGAVLRRGTWQAHGARLGWRFLPAPGHLLCVVHPGSAPARTGLRWLPWQVLA